MDASRLALWHALHSAGQPVIASKLNASFFEVTATLFHSGQIDQFPQRVNLVARCDFQRRWDAVAPGHTLATQAINRGMTLEALAALLGHKTLSMTLVYARIANRTVANEYFSVSEKVEALYDQPKQLPADAEGNQMRKLRAEMHRRMLGNGYCARPIELDCHFESICESCTYFVTTIEFLPTLEKQRTDAEAKGQVGRAKVFQGLLNRLDADAS